MTQKLAVSLNAIWCLNYEPDLCVKPVCCNQMSFMQGHNLHSLAKKKQNKTRKNLFTTVWQFHTLYPVSYIAGQFSKKSDSLFFPCFSLYLNLHPGERVENGLSSNQKQPSKQISLHSFLTSIYFQLILKKT